MAWLTRARRALDRAFNSALAVVAPGRAVVRQHLRRMDSDADYREAFLLGLRLHGYRNARAAGTPWLGSGGSADAESLSDLPALRNRSREIRRDDPLGSGLLKTFVANVVGTGLRPQARTVQSTRNAQLEAVWNDARRRGLAPAEALTCGELQRLLVGKMLEDGDVYLKASYVPGEPVWFEVIEADRIATPPGALGGPDIRDGVERDAAGRIAAYHVMRCHPGDAGGKPTLDTTRVPAQYVGSLRLVDRPGQSRGVPVLHAVLQDLRDLDLLLLASLKRTQIAACLAVFIESTAKTPSLLSVTAEQYGYRLDQDLEPGMIFKLNKDEKVSTLVPNFPTPELEPFVIMLARRIGAALGVSWQIVLKDFSKANYSSARTDLLEARGVWLIMQDLFRERILDWMWFQVLADARLRGDPRVQGLSDDDLRAVYWIAPGWRWVDPLKEAQAAEVRVRLGLDTIRDLCAADGKDWEEQLAQAALEMKRRAELGLPAAAVPGAPAAADAGESLVSVEEAA